MPLYHNRPDGIVLAWPTPVMIRRNNDAALCAELRRVILAKREEDPEGISRALVNGWHSDTDMMDWPDPVIAKLKAVIQNGLHDYLNAMTEGRPVQGQAQVTAWANVSERGGYHRLHTHHSSMVSGVFYVDTGTPDPDDTKKNGTLAFVDPRVAVEMIPIPGNPFGDKLQLQPEPGHFVLFPSWLQHFVDPFRGEGTRISIAFNITIAENPAPDDPADKTAK